MLKSSMDDQKSAVHFLQITFKIVEMLLKILISYLYSDEVGRNDIIECISYINYLSKGFIAIKH